ncbi:MAG: hypothetical protein ACI9Y7_000765 [Dokdonia sp.]|jgi:hypothetical protein
MMFEAQNTLLNYLKISILIFSKKNYVNLYLFYKR